MAASLLAGDIHEEFDPVADADDFEIKHEIGRGGGGTVYLAEDRRVGRQVALKLLNNLRSDDESERRFRGEVEAIGSLDHPNIIPIYSHGDLDGRPFFTMKYVDGGDLATRQKDFSTKEEVAAMMHKLARAVHHAHQRGILHRDLKPSNILIDQDGEPYVTDFGLAKRTDDDMGITMTGAVMGTPAYMSPEQAKGGSNTVTTVSDVFSLGAIFYQLLTGRLAFDGETSNVVLKNVIEQDVSFTSMDLGKTDRDLATICLKCLEKDQDRRYSSALALAKELDRWQRGDPIEARPISQAEKLMRWVRRKPALAGTAAFAVLAVIVGTAVSLFLWNQAVNEREIAIEQKNIAEENDYYSTIATAMTARERFDFGAARRMLDSTDESYRGFEWCLVAGLCESDAVWTSTLENSRPVQFALNPPDGRIHLLTDDRRIYEIDAESGKLIRLPGGVPVPPEGSSQTAVFTGLQHFGYSMDGRHLSVVDGDKLLIVSSENQQVLHTLDIELGPHAIWLDANRVLFGWGALFSIQPSDNAAWMFDLTTGEVETLPHGFSGPFSLSADRRWLALGKFNRTVEVFDLEQPGFFVAPAFAYTADNQIWDIDISQDANHMAVSWTVQGGSNVRVFNLATGERIFKQPWVINPKVVLGGSAQDSVMISGREPWFTSWRYNQPDDNLNTFDDGDLTPTPHRVGGPFSPPKRLSTRTTAGNRTRFYFGNNALMTASIAVPGESGDVMTAAEDGSVSRWGIGRTSLDGRRRSEAKTMHGWFHPTASTNGAYVFYLADGNGTDNVRLWHRSSVADSWVIDFPPKHNYLASLRDGRAIVREDETGEVTCWQCRPDGERELLWTLEDIRSHPGYPQTIHTSITPDEKWIAALQAGKFVVIDPDTPAIYSSPYEEMVHGSTPGQTITISPDGKTVAVTGFAGRRVRIYRVADLGAGHTKLIAEDQPATNDSACVFSPDGRSLYVGNDDGRVRVFDTGTWKERPDERWHPHSAEVTALAISQAGDIVATSGDSSTALWSAEKVEGKRRRERLRITSETARNWIQFCRGDTRLMHSGHNGSIEVWDVPPL